MRIRKTRYEKRLDWGDIIRSWYRHQKARNWSMLPISVLALKETGKLASLVWYEMLCPGHTAGTYFWDTIPNLEEWSHHKADLSWRARAWVHVSWQLWTFPHHLRHCHSTGIYSPCSETVLAGIYIKQSWKSALHGDRDTQRAQLCLLLCWCAEVSVKPSVDILLLSPEPGAQWDLHRRARHHKAFRHHWRRAHAAELSVIFFKTI